MKNDVAELVKASHAPVDAVTFDESGMLVGQIWTGGNGGLLSRETIVKADTLRSVLRRFEQEFQMEGVQ